MTSDAKQRYSALVMLQATALVAGMVLLLASTVTRGAALPLISGPCLAFSGTLLLFGIRTTLTGRIGTMLRTALGPMSVVNASVRAWLWIALGVAVTTWGVYRLQARDSSPPFWEAPVVNTDRASPSTSSRGD